MNKKLYFLGAANEETNLCAKSFISNPFFGILKEMIETNFSVSVWHILKQLFTSVPLEVEDIHPTA